MSAKPGAKPSDLQASLRGIFPFEPHFFETPAGRLHYVDVGPRSGEPMLMLHGNPTWSFHYRHLIHAFSPENRVVALDHLGCGLSDKPQDFEYTLEHHIDHVESLVAALGLDGLTLIVHDWGGAIGMGFAVRHPKLVRRLVVLNTAAFPSTRIPLSIDLCRVPAFGALAIRGLNAFARVALLRCIEHRDRLTADVRRGYLAPYSDWKSRVALLRFVEDIPLDRSHRSYALLEEIGDKIAMFAGHPMLIAWGGRDFVFDRHFFNEWRARFPGARAEYLEDAGHYVLEDAHERIVPWIRELLRSPARSERGAVDEHA